MIAVAVVEVESMRRARIRECADVRPLKSKLADLLERDQRIVLAEVK